MEIINIDINKLKPYKNNPRKNDEAVEYVANSIKEFGFKVPIIVDKDYEIIAGHTRLKSAKKLGLKEVPIIIADDLTEEQVKAFRLADNKVSEVAEWDFNLLDNELSNILDIDMSIFGFDVFEEEEEQEIIEDDFEIELPKEPKAKLGDIYQLGNHRLMCGDSTKEENVAKLMNGNKADMVFTDPPYNVQFNGRSGKFEVIENDDLSNEEFNIFIGKTIDLIKKLNPPIYYIWCNWKFYGILQEKLEFKNCIVWAKNVFGLGKGYRHQHEFCLFNGIVDDDIKNESDLWEIAKDSNYIHPTQKPVALCGRALKNHKKVVNVLDLFGGSGSTLIACEQLNRKCYMMELDPKYVDVIIERWETFTGKKAVLLNKGEIK
jgi:site-specific DNA-methyltransferase (adenine-specific)